MIFAGVLLIEGLGPMLFPKQWQRMVIQLAKQHPQSLRRIGGCLVSSGLVLLWIFSSSQ
ncbi:DUF2065 domain-containing protein [Ferrimonas lipolytica]